jgi:hypothetical protein
VFGPGLTRLVPPAGVVEADGAATGLVQARVVDVNHNPVGDAEVMFSIPANTLSGSVFGPAAIAVLTDTTGTAAVAVASYHAGDYLVTARVDGQSITEGSPAVVVFEDTAIPGVPVVNGSNGSRITGSVHSGDLLEAARGHLVVVVVDHATGIEITRGIPAADGAFDLSLAPLDHGTEVRVHVEDHNGNRSGPAHVMVDSQPPAGPRSRPSDGRELSGVGGEPGNTITVVDAAGTVRCTTLVAADGSWVCVLVPQASVGDILGITETDSVGNQTTTVWRIGLPTLALSGSEFQPGAQVELMGTNFQPGEQAAVEMRSDPVDLGRVTADQDGAFQLSWTVPEATPPGTHTVEVDGALSGAWRIEFTVAARDQSTQSPSPGNPTASPTGVGPGELPITGTQVGGIVALAVLTILFGVALVTAARRRRIDG